MLDCSLLLDPVGVSDSRRKHLQRVPPAGLGVLISDLLVVFTRYSTDVGVLLAYRIVSPLSVWWDYAARKSDIMGHIRI